MELGLGASLKSLLWFALPLSLMSVLLLQALVTIASGISGEGSWIGQNSLLLRCFAFVFGVGGSIVVPRALLLWRQRRGVRITWDDWGITEWDGEAVRTAIPWATAQYRTSLAYEKVSRRFLEVTDGESRAIRVFSTLPKLLLPNRRRAEAEDRPTLDRLVDVVSRRCGNMGVLKELPDLDEHRPKRKGWLPYVSAGVGYYLAFGSTIGVLREPLEPILWSTLIAASALFLRLIRPVRELVSLGKVGRALRDAVPVEVYDSAGSLVLARDKAGEELKVETRRLSHPDAALAERRGIAWMILDRVETKRSADPYRGGGGPSRALAYESAAARATRRTRIAAVWGELLARLAFVLLVVSVGAGANFLVERADLYHQAWVLDDHEDVPGNLERAVSRYRRSCRLGFAMACHNLALMYEQGRGVEVDNSEARKLYQRACDGGFMLGCNNLAVQYAKGHGVVQDSVRAVSLYRKACEGNLAIGCRNLGYNYEHGKGVAQDLAKAAELHRRSCDLGDSEGCNNLGNLYVAGRGVKENLNLAVALFRQACEGGSSWGCDNAGTLAYEGKGVSRDHQWALQLYRRACEGGLAKGCANLAFMYGNGYGTAKDDGLAAEFYQKGCDGGIRWGCDNLGTLYFRGRGVPRDDSVAFELYRRACDAGLDRGCSHLGRMYEGGHGVDVDLDRASELYESACEGGFRVACEAYDLITAPRSNPDAGLADAPEPP